MMVANSTASVEVFMPPAVDPDDPPTNINIIIVSSPTWLIAFRFTVLNPAVLGVTVWNIEANILSPSSIS